MTPPQSAIRKEQPDQTEPAHRAAQQYARRVESGMRDERRGHEPQGDEGLDRKPDCAGLAQIALSRSIGRTMIVESIVATSVRSAVPIANTSAWQTVSVRPGRSTWPQARKLSPRAGASRLILNSTARTSVRGAARVLAA